MTIVGPQYWLASSLSWTELACRMALDLAYLHTFAWSARSASDDLRHQSFWDSCCQVSEAPSFVRSAKLATIAEPVSEGLVDPPTEV